MPKINRIRIANVPYNGKFIADEMLDLYQGENLLINLANGSGKSVLTQMMLQPILPTVKLHQRKIESYLTSKEPTFVMIEWILDNTMIPTYLLTGIVMNKTVTEDNNTRVKYFTFINKYTSSNQFDIKNIDFISKEKGIMRYKSYDYCLKSLKEQVGSKSEIQVFSRDDASNYKEQLAEYGIFKEEWKILANINENEGGVDEIFTKCKDSDKLIDEWILKTISTNLDTGEVLQEMFVRLMSDIMENEEDIKQRDELLNFKAKVDEYILELSELLKNMDKEGALKNELEEIYLSLCKIEFEKKNKIQEIKNKIIELEQEEKQIDYEELSKEFYDFESNLNAAVEVKESKIKIEEKERKKFKEIKLQIRLMEAARLYKELVELEAEREAELVAKRKLENEIQSKDLEDIEYSLKKAYKNQIDIYDTNLKELKSNEEQIAIEQKKRKEEWESCLNEREDAIKKKTEIKTKMDLFKQHEENLLKKLEIVLSRNILEEIDKKETIKILNSYDEQKENIENANIEIDQEIKKKITLIEENKNKVKELDEFKNSLQEKFVGKNFTLENYQQRENELKVVLKNLAIQEEKIWDRDTNLVDVNRRIENIRKQKDETSGELNKKQEIIWNLQNGGIHIQGTLGKIFSNQKIDYETGEDYLKEQPNEYQEKILSKNPMLPYCYIVKKKDYEKIESLNLNEELTRLTPIITYEDIEQDFKPNHQFIEITGKVKFACLYNKSSFDYIDKNKFEENLVQEIQELKYKNQELESKLFDLDNYSKVIEKFQFDKNYKENLIDEIKRLKEQQDNSKAEQKDLEEINDRLNKEISNLRLEKVDNEVKITNCKETKQEFLDFLDENEIYMQNRKIDEECESRIKELDGKKVALGTNIEELREEFNSTQEKIKNLNNNKDELSIKYSKIPEIKNGSIIEKSIEALEKMYEEISTKFKRDKEDINSRLNKLSEKIVDKNNYINKNFQEIKGSFEQIIYNEEEEDRLKENLLLQEKEFDFAKAELQEATLKETSMKERRNNALSNLQKMGKEEPCPGYLIKGNYDERRILNKKNIKQENEYFEMISKEIEKIGNKKSILLRAIDIPQMRQIELQNVDYTKISIKEKMDEYLKLKDENKTSQNKLNNHYTDIKNQNEGINQVINNFLTNMNPYQEGKQFADYYFVYERVNECLKTMIKILGQIETTLKHIEDDKNNIKHQAFLQGKNIYLEMKKISESANVKMPGKLRKTPLLEIEIPKELDTFAETRINDYIEECIKNLREECKVAENKQSLIDKKIKEWLSDRELLNKVINSETIEVKLYKIDISEKNSGLRKWKEVIVDNSGGEKFISCLILVIALIQYSRTKIFEKIGNDQTLETTKIFIIDNPFGKMSSTHLLKGLTNILEKFNVQAICLSDLSQSSITNQFKVIYQMSLKTGKYTEKSYLTTDRITTNGEISKNYFLEQAYVKQEEQLRIF